MNKTIIAVYGRKDEGKSSSIKLVCQKLLDEFPNATSSIPKEEISYSADILVIITLGSIRIGIESQGDPKSRMITEETIKYLAEEKCDIILCATRTGGETVHKVDEIAGAYNYRTLWLSTFWGHHLDHDVLNNQLSDQIIRFITSLIVGQL